jgi:hypothetical protein
MLEPPLREPLKQAAFFPAVVASDVFAFIVFKHATKLSGKHLTVGTLIQNSINKVC